MTTPAEQLPSLQDEARRVLTSPDLKDKLTFASRCIDRPEPAGRLPRLPGRPPELRFSALPASRRAADFPTDPRRLDDSANRGLALHYFANHELLALEIMALMILRFHDAPPAFRRGLAQTLQEEQVHLALYLERMGALGVEFGSHPVNDYFWRLFERIEQPAAYLAGMSLTFEQANLDFSRWFADRFREVGDLASARTMDRVWEDEIRHVKFGRVWLARTDSRDPSGLGPGSGGGSRTLFESYCRALPEPLTLRRARGIGFDAEGRRRAGLPEDFMAAVRSAADSKGRTPRVWRFNPGWDHALRGEAQPRIVQTVTHDLAPLLAVVAAPDDVVEAEPESAEHRARLFDAGLQPARLCRKATGQIRWWSRAPAHLASKTFGHGLTPALKEAFAGDPCVNPEDFGGIASSESEVVHRLGGDPVRLKHPIGTSGRGQRVVRTPDTPDRSWIRTGIERYGVLIVEPELDSVLELGLMLDTRRKQPLLGFLGLLCDARGTYRGHVLSDPLRLLSPLDLRALGGGRGLAERLRKTAAVVADALRAEGHHGPAGVDSILYRRSDGVALRPVVEVNPRLTFGHVAWALRHHVAPKVHAEHRILPKHRLPTTLAPLRKDSRGRWISGQLLTTDPSRARRFVGLVHITDPTGTPRHSLEPA